MFVCIALSLALQANVLAQRQREELLGSARKDRQVIDCMGIIYFIASCSSQTGSALTRRTELYLKEHEHIRGYAGMHGYELYMHIP